MNSEPTPQVIDALRIILMVAQGETLTHAALRVRSERDAYMGEVARLRLQDLEYRADLGRLRQALTDIRIGVDEGSMSSVDIRVRIADALGTRNGAA